MWASMLVIMLSVTSGLSKLLVYEFLTPIMYENPISHVTKAIDAYHAGIGFQDLGSFAEHTFELNADPSFFGSFLPRLTPEGEVEWNNGAVIEVKESVNWTHWTIHNRIYEIDNAIFEKYQEWVEEYKKEKVNQQYYLFDVSVGNKTIFSSHNCQDFLKDSFRKLKELGAVQVWENSTIPLDYISFFVDDVPSEIDYEQEKKKIYDFYSKLEGIFKVEVIDLDSIEEIIRKCLEFLGEEFIYYYNEKYFTMNLVSPWFIYAFQPWELP